MWHERWRHRIIASFALLLLAPSAPAQKPVVYTKWNNYTTANGMPDNRVLSVAVDGNRVWAGTQSGLVLLENGRVKKVLTPADGLANRVVTGIAVDKNTDDLWIATLGGLSHYSGGLFQNYTALSSGLVNNIVYAVAVEAGYIWAGTAMGISRLNTRTGEWTTFAFGSAADAIDLSTANAYFALWGGGVLHSKGKRRNRFLSGTILRASLRERCRTDLP
jgi:ligand-binding sensor domain-containing protein